MKVLVRKCRFTGKIFEEKDLAKYAAHLKKVRQELKQARAEAHSKKTFKAWLKKEKEKITSIDQIGPWFLENQKKIQTAANAILFPSHSKMTRGDRFVPADNFTKVEIIRASYKPIASNSHRCPEGGVTNWCGKDPGAPRGYPGWEGSMSVALTRPDAKNWSYPTSDALDLVGIRTGSGGGGNENSNWEITIFLDDWPGLRAQLVMDKLKGV